MPTLSVKDANNTTQTINTMNANGQAVAANSQSVVIASDHVVPTSIATEGHHYQPGYDPVGPAGTLMSDPDNNLVVRGQMLTDEGGYRCNFANTSLFVSIGTCTFTNNSDIVTGTGFDLVDLRTGDYVKITAHADTVLVQVDTVSPTELKLLQPYTGATTTGAAVRAILKPVTGAGATISVASSVCTIAAGTTTGALSEVERDVDWLPVMKQVGVSVSQRIVNQSIYIGFYDESNPTTPYYMAWFLLDGTVNTTVKCQTGRNPTAAPTGAEIEETAVTLPSGLTTATSLRYRIEALGDRVVFYINGAVVATHFRATPGFGDVLTSTVRVVNGTSPATNTNIAIDYDCVKNHNKVEVGIFSDAEGIVAQNAPVDVFSYSQAGVITINTDLLFIDCSRYKSLVVQCISMGTTGVVTPAFSSDDGTTFGSATLQVTSGGAVATTFNAAGTWVIPVTGRIARLRLTTATTAGTTTLRVVGSQQAINMPAGTVTVTASNLSTNVAQMNGVAVTMGNGVAGTGVQRVAIASDNTANTNPWLVTASPSAAQGAGTTFHLISAASTNATSVKGSAGTVCVLQVSNLNAAARFLKLYNKATAPTVGTDTPVMTIMLPAGSNQFIDCGSYGARFSTGIALALTTGIAVADTGAVALSEHSVSIFYV